MICPRRFPSAFPIALSLLVLLAAGCSRAHYRRQADREVYTTIDSYAKDPRWQLDDYSIRPKPASRMFDPCNPDQPPLPPDDPASHRMMHCVDCKKGWPHWHANGDTLDVENPRWRIYLPRNEQGQLVLDREGAICLGFLHSREYQQELEDLYLTALDVTFQRYRFDTQFFFKNSETFQVAGPLAADGSKLTAQNNLKAQKLLATGGTLAVGLANQLVWQFSGTDSYTANTLVDFSLVQPLLRAGGRAIALEGLTDVERALLANVRQMERFRQAFWVQLINGRTPGTGPIRGGLALASLSPVVTSGAQTGTGGAVGGAGMLGLLAEQQSIENQRANVAALRSAVEQLEITFLAGRIPDRYQVDYAAQTLYNAQSSLLSLIKSHQDRLDAYKIQLGLPPSVAVKLSDPLTKRFNVIDPALTDLSEAVLDLLNEVRDPKVKDDAGPLPQWTGQLSVMRQRTAGWLATVEKDLLALDQAVPQRTADLRGLTDREEVRQGDMERSMVDVGAFEKRVATAHSDYQEAVPRINAAMAAIEEFEKQGPSAPRDPAALHARRERLEALALELSLQLSDLSLVQARARLDTFTLVPIELSTAEALEIARANRLDWMNARAALMDVWRQIEVRANALQSDLNLSLGGDISTLDNNPLRFRSTTGRLRAGVEFDAPLTRLAERNLYRESLIEYQRARRAYSAYEDRISQGLRAIIYAIQLDQLNFEIRRAAVRLALTQTELTHYRLTRPPKPGEATVLGVTTSRDLVDALQALLNAQNGILSVWIDFETQRMNLDLDLGTFRLDGRCMWIDPGPIRPGDLPAAGPEEILPPDPAASGAQLTRLPTVSKSSQ